MLLAFHKARLSEYFLLISAGHACYDRSIMGTSADIDIGIHCACGELLVEIRRVVSLILFHTSHLSDISASKGMMLNDRRLQYSKEKRKEIGT